MRRISQQGSAHVVIIVVLVVALLGALGYIFYNNFIAKKADTSKKDSGDSKVVATSKQEAPKEELTTVALNDVFVPGLSYRYPVSWTERRTSSGAVPITMYAATQQGSIVTSADKAVDVTISMMVGGGIGGTCIPDDTSPVDWFATEKSTKLDGFAYVEYIYKVDGGWHVQQGLSTVDKATKVKVGESGCTTAFLTINGLPKLTTVDPSAMLSTNISPHGKDGVVTFATLDAAKTYLVSDTGKKVKQIFLSIQ